MKEIYDFLKQCNTYYLATTDGEQPRVRPFGTVNIFENKLYIQTGKVKKVYNQIKANPRIEISGTVGNRWIRVEATAVEDDRIEPKQSILRNKRDNTYHSRRREELRLKIQDVSATFAKSTETKTEPVSEFKIRSLIIFA